MNITPVKPGSINAALEKHTVWEDGNDGTIISNTQPRTPSAVRIPGQHNKQNMVQPPLNPPVSSNITNPQLPKGSTIGVEPLVVTEEQHKPKVDHRVEVDNLEDIKYVKAQSKNPNNIRESLPSHCLPYDFDDIEIRQFKARDLSKIYRSAIDENFSLIVDAIGATVNIDIRQLTMGDFTFLMYWHRINSYPKSPYIIEWTSRYGNANKYTVNGTNLIINEMKLTQLEFDTYSGMGLCLPTVKDLEVLQTIRLTPDQQYIYNLAQFIKGDSIKEKIEILDSFEDLSIQEYIKEFREKTEHGVIETVKVIDNNFDLNISIANIQKQQDNQLIMFKSRFKQNMQESELIRLFQLNMTPQQKDLFEELEIMRYHLEQGKTYLPREEELTLTVNALSFFP